MWKGSKSVRQEISQQYSKSPALVAEDTTSKAVVINLVWITVPFMNIIKPHLIF